MKDRIQKIIDLENITASKFADIIGVQRSSVSHIISGRNKPSLDFVQKILSAFPQVNSDWLLFGTGNVYKSDAKSADTQTNEQQDSPTRTQTKENQSTMLNDNSVDNDNELKMTSPEPKPSPKPQMSNVNNVQQAAPQVQNYSTNQTQGNQQMYQQSQTTNQQFVNNDAAMFSQQKPKPIDILANNPDRIIVFYSDKTFDWFSPMGK